MIRVTKSSTVPGPLSGSTSRGAKATLKLCRDHDAGVIDHEFSSKIYGDKKVKATLIADQSGKCLFCEAKINHTQHGDVEHFRPKGGYTESANGVLIKPGYYWLAYEWSNLTFGCQICNQIHKKNYFPLLNPQHRAKSHLDNVNLEQPVLVNPTTEDPDLFIGFRHEVAFGKDGAGRGKQTIDAVGLNRLNLRESRRELLSKFRNAWALLLKAEQLAKDHAVPIPPELVEQRLRLEQWTLPSQEYSAMIQSARALYA